MRLYNTLKRKVEPFTPLQGNEARIYSCGPTVYNHAHIGNLSSYIFADTLRRALKTAEFDVKHVMNYTDVDDKTIRRSREQYPADEPQEALQKLTGQYIGIFLEDMKKIGNDTDSLTFLRATDHIKDMQALITALLKGNFAYLADDGVYFSIDAYRNGGHTYGQLSRIDANSTSEARIANDEYDKESIHDFALWKKQKEGEPAWDFTVDGIDMRGRPGWHIECSAMSRTALGQPFDIHTGGVDLIFPHHENEIAQSTALELDHRMAQFFSHNEHMLVDGKKMSKSLGNFFTLEDIVNKGYDPLAFRLLALQSHYRHQSNFSWENLEAAQNRFKSFQALADLRFQLDPNNEATVDFDFGSIQDAIQSALEVDLSTPQALAAVSEAEQFLNVHIPGEQQKQEFMDFLDFLDRVFGLQLLSSTNINEEQKNLLNIRAQARANKAWQKADELRDRLKEQEIDVRDTPHGQIWSRS